MGDSDISEHEFRPQVGEIQGLLDVVNFATNKDSLRSWLQDQDDIDYSEFTSGYLLFLETGVRRFLHICENNADVGLKSDFISDRAIAQLPQLSDIPHSSEKLDFCRAIEEIQRQIRGIGQPSCLTNLLSEAQNVMLPLIELRESIHDVSEISDSSLDPNQVNRDVAILSLFTYFQQARNNMPQGYGPSNLDTWITSGPRQKSITGYATTLKFVWSQLLSQDEFGKASIDDLTQSKRWTPRDLWQLQENGYDREPDTCLTDFNSQIKDIIISPINQRYEQYASLGKPYPDDLIRIPPDTNLRQHITSLISSSSERTPQDLDPHARVLYGLIWFRQAEWISMGPPGNFWLVESVLRGLEHSYNTFDEEVPIHITRFNHSIEGHGNLVSYAILQRVPQRALGDPSVWLIFDSFAADYEIEGEARIERTEALMEDLQNRNPVERLEINVDRDKFIEAVSERLTDDYLDLRLANENLLRAVETSRGVLTELATVYVLSKRFTEMNIRWSTKIHGEEIDVLVQSGDCVRVIECKASIDSAGVNATIDQLSRKVNTVDSNDRAVNGEIWVWEQPSDQAISKLAQHEIQLVCLRNAEEIVEASTEDVENVFETFLPEVEERHMLAPPERYNSDSVDKP